jgi:hypothetical protein
VFQISGQPDRKPGKAYKEGAVRINGIACSASRIAASCW